jgi:hypothetical protein
MIMFSGKRSLHVTNGNKYVDEGSFGFYCGQYLFIQLQLYLKTIKSFLSYGTLACKIRTLLV